ncbi:MAG: hypothetical protein O7G85_16180, partial [Planctomycetota bacterium]|nr:hypothetical protein [Planctomycetota bacterium]
MPETRQFRQLASLLVGIAALGMSPGQVWSQSITALEGLPDLDPSNLASLTRTIRVFDFEEAQQRLVEFPDNFFRRSGRTGASAEGFPPFGSMSLSRDTSFSGNWSFKFELEGGSMAARTFDGILPILPYADYAVTTRIRTKGLVHARARVVAWINDKHGEIIPGSRVESPLLHTPETWETVSIEIRGHDAQAADLIVELQVLQPRQFLSQEADLSLPIFEDFFGAVWFDEVRVLHLPQAELRCQGESRIIIRPDRPELSILVRDHASEPLVSNLMVYDLDGRLVFEETYGPSQGKQSRNVTLPIDDCGWYRAVLLVHSGGALTGRRWLDFAIVSDETRTLITSQNRFGVVLPNRSMNRLSQVADLISHLKVGQVVLPVWTRRMDQPGRAESLERLRYLIPRLLDRNIDLTFALNELPSELAQTLGLDPHQVIEMFREDPAIWRPYLEPLLVNFGLEVQRWQIGATGSSDYLMSHVDGSLLVNARKSMSQFIADPQLFVPWPAEHALPSRTAIESIH